MRFTGRSREAFALSVVLWIVAALLLGIAFVLHLSRDTLNLTKDLQEKLEARLQAESYLEAVKFYVLSANFDNFRLIGDTGIREYKLPREIIVDGREYNLTKHVTLSIRDASSMINLFYPDTKMIAAIASESNTTLYHTIDDSIKDWIDTDNAERLNGAEESYYKKEKGALYGPRNYPTLQSVEELYLIKGVDTLTSNDLQHLKTYLYSAELGAEVNLALVDANYLSKLLHIDKESARALIEYKYTNFAKFLSIVQKSPYYNEDKMRFALSFKMFVRVVVSVGDAQVRVETLIDFRPNIARDITTGFYRIY